MRQNREPRLAASVEKRFTLVWHAANPNEKTWIEEIFSPYISSIVTDTDHKLIMDDCIVCDAFIHRWNPAYYAGFRGKNAFLIHFLDESYEGHYDLYQNFKGVFRNFDASVFNPAYVKALPLGFSAGVSGGREVRPALERRYIWSFTGQINKAPRPDVAT